MPSGQNRYGYDLSDNVQMVEPIGTGPTAKTKPVALAGFTPGTGGDVPRAGQFPVTYTDRTGSKVTTYVGSDASADALLELQAQIARERQNW